MTTSKDRGEPSLADFLGVQPRLFGIAYRILGTAAEAEDLVQDVWLRWQRTDRSRVVNAPAFLAVVATRLAINRARSLSVRQEAHEVPWAPEPADAEPGPGLTVERGEQLERAISILLERLSARERAAYVLREAFNYPYLRIAAVLRVSEVSSRQLVTRARRHVADQRRARVSSLEARRLAAAFVRAARSGEVATLEGLFAAEASA